jgi:hypothetical protein
VTSAHGFQPLSDPPADLHRTELPLVALAPAITLCRIHRLTDMSLSFGRDARNRFDDPDREFGVCYFGLTADAAFAEAMLRRPRVRLISRAFVDERGLSEFSPTRLLRLVRLHGPGLAQIGATADIASGPHDIARTWSRALWGQPSQPDGIEYRCRHDDDQLAVALYDRDTEVVQRVQTRGLRDDPAWFGAVLHRYDVGLDE